MDKDVNPSSELIDVSDRSKDGVTENNVNSDSDTAVAQNEPEWFRDGDAWVKLFLEPIAPGKFRQHDYVYNVPGENEFPKERWSSEECIDGFHITLRKDVWFHLPLHNYKSAYIADVVSMGDEFYDNPRQFKRKVRVVTLGPAVPLVGVLGKHPDDFKNDKILVWSVKNNHIEMVNLVASNSQLIYNYGWAFHLTLVNRNDRIAEILIEKCVNDEDRKDILLSAIKYGRADFVKQLAEKTPLDVRFFQTACSRGHFEIFELLCAKYGEPKCSEIIIDALRGGNVDILKYLKSKCVVMTDFGMFVYACTNYTASNTNTVEYLVSEGADVKHPLIAYIAKRHALWEVCEYLLTQIDDKWNVPKCEEFDREMSEFRTKFIKRIRAGEFD
jgi:hypothetical protein